MEGRRVRLVPLAVVVAAACASLGPTPSAPPAPVLASISDSSCSAALDSLMAIFRHDYPGYRDKVTGHEAALAALTDSVRAVARTASQYQVCIPALRRWAEFFQDPHVTGPWQSSPPPARRNASPPPPPLDLGAPDPNRPSWRFLDDSTALLRIPTFSEEYGPVIDSVVGANRRRLEATPYLVVDLRGNDGGSTESYRSLTPLLYANPVRFDGADVWASPANIVHYRAMLSDTLISTGVRHSIQEAVWRMEARVNQWVELRRDTIVGLDTVLPMPRTVAVVMDSVCASTCEDFLLEVRQSAKVTVMGVGHTAGVHDYGEVRGVWLPGWRRVALPTNRARGPRIDHVGIAPTVWIPRTEQDPVEFARRHIYTRPARSVPSR